MLYLLVLAGKTLLTAAVLLVVYALYRHMQKLEILNYYEKQGVKVIPGAKSLLGNLKDWREYEAIVKKDGNKVEGPFRYILSKMSKGEGHEIYDPARYPLILINLLTDVYIMITDCEVVQELYTTKN